MDLKKEEEICPANSFLPGRTSQDRTTEDRTANDWAGPPSTIPVMPDFTRPQYGFYHTVDSALAALSETDMGPERITIKKAGRGWRNHRIVEQRPLPGAALTSDVIVELTVEGDSAFYFLPTGMREGGSLQEAGIDDLVELLDDPLEKAAYTIRQGGMYFDVRQSGRPECARWIRLFGIDPDEWPEDKLYELAVLLPCMHRLAGRESGLRLALNVLMGLDVHSIHRRRKRTLLAPDEQSRLGERASRLGTDLVIGNGMEDEAGLEITLGPVSLETYRFCIAEEGERRLTQLFRLVLPYHLTYSINWLVGKRGLAPRLGIEQENSVLGVNMHLGRR
jgi:hypothetical protein